MDKVTENVRAAKRRLEKRRRQKIFWLALLVILVLGVGAIVGLWFYNPALIVNAVSNIQNQISTVVQNLSPRPKITPIQVSMNTPTLTPEPTTTNTPTATTTPIPTRTFTPTSTPMILTINIGFGNIYMRSGPGIKYPPVALLKDKQKVEFIQCYNSYWAMIKANEIYGYANTYYLEKVCR